MYLRDVERQTSAYDKHGKNPFDGPITGFEKIQIETSVRHVDHFVPDETMRRHTISDVEEAVSSTMSALRRYATQAVLDALAGINANKYAATIASTFKEPNMVLTSPTGLTVGKIIAAEAILGQLNCPAEECFIIAPKGSSIQSLYADSKFIDADFASRKRIEEAPMGCVMDFRGYRIVLVPNMREGGLPEYTSGGNKLRNGYFLHRDTLKVANDATRYEIDIFNLKETGSGIGIRGRVRLGVAAYDTREAIVSLPLLSGVAVS